MHASARMHALVCGCVGWCLDRRLQIAALRNERSKNALNTVCPYMAAPR